MSGTWTSVDIAGKPAEIYDPPVPPRFGLIYLHGIGQETLSDKQKYTDVFAAMNLGCVVPRGGFTWWSDRVLPEYDPVRSAAQYVRAFVAPYLKQRWALGERAVGLFGVSMGAQGALRRMFKYANE